MPYQRLFLLVEGDDEERLIKAILQPLFLRRYDHVQIWKYAQETSKKTRQFIDSIIAMQADFIFLRDFDAGHCLSSRKTEIQDRYNRRIDGARIVIVVEECESWYAAGIEDETAKRLGIDEFASTDNLTKEQFNASIPKRFDSRIHFLLEVLKAFDVEAARRKNASFDYFFRKHLDN